MNYRAMEMHTHTRHSDGSFTMEELCRAAKEKGFEGLAITDHNTLSAYEHITPQLEAETLPVVRGIEWTTFFGHMLVLGADHFVDWRFATPNNIDEYLQKIHEENGVVGVAHPFHLGSPFCTGCHWTFNVKDWELIDYIEVWSEAFPQLNPINQRAFQWWTDLLNRGFHIAASQGRDWHGPSAQRESMSVTYLGIEGDVVNTQTVKDALRHGRSYITCGPGLLFELEQNAQRAGLGQTIQPGATTAHISIDCSLRQEQWEGFGIRPKTLHVVQNGVTLLEIPCEEATIHTVELNLWPGWVRLEARGDYMQQEEPTLLAFTSPIYVAE